MFPRLIVNASMSIDGASVDYYASPEPTSLKCLPTCPICIGKYYYIAKQISGGTDCEEDDDDDGLDGGGDESIKVASEMSYESGICGLYETYLDLCNVDDSVDGVAAITTLFQICAEKYPPFINRPRITQTQIETHIENDRRLDKALLKDSLAATFKDITKLIKATPTNQLHKQYVELCRTLSTNINQRKGVRELSSPLDPQQPSLKKRKTDLASDTPITTN